MCRTTLIDIRLIWHVSYDFVRHVRHVRLSPFTPWYHCTIRIGPDGAYPLHFTLPQLLQLLCVFETGGQKWWENEMEYVSFCFWVISFEIIKFQPLISLYIWLLVYSARIYQFSPGCFQSVMKALTKISKPLVVNIWLLMFWKQKENIILLKFSKRYIFIEVATSLFLFGTEFQKSATPLRRYRSWRLLCQITAETDEI